MAEIGKVTFSGKSGKRYEFKVYTLDDKLFPSAAVYAVTRRTLEGLRVNHERIFIGQTGNLEETFKAHPQASCFKRENANCVCVHLYLDEQSRRAMEADLLAKTHPVCNA